MVSYNTITPSIMFLHSKNAVWAKRTKPKELFLNSHKARLELGVPGFSLYLIN
jgi:hypothetical protein